MLRPFQLTARPFVRHYALYFDYWNKWDDKQFISPANHKQAIAIHEFRSSRDFEFQHQLHMSTHKGLMDNIQSCHERRMQYLQDSFKDEIQTLKSFHKACQKPTIKILREREKELRKMDIECKELKKQTLRVLSEKMWLEQNFNIRGALEQIVYQFREPEDIRSSKGIQKGLDEIAETGDFIAVRDKVVQERGLERERVIACIHSIYHEVSKHAHGNDGTIVVRAIDFTPNERAALVTFLKLQSTWKNPLVWQEEGLSDEGKERV
ncbi:unnamed protein product [Tuber aestivum]|uniref:Uncharacterized protein n=1 Tax=Tuber aestivum TaxID=59557 RepID=A0A292PIC9_9PEZI|nr:unnamed protein product [Tuber aestivum]